MIEFNLDTDQSAQPGDFTVSVIGIGGSGANVLDRIALEGMPGAELICMNSDVRALTTSMASKKVQLGRTLTQGLGAGGDPDLGLEAAVSSSQEIRDALAGRSMVFICTGLGGGTGSGAAPYVAQLAREAGAFVVVFATMPFFFEGKRRNAQAQAALHALRRHANALVCFDNDRMGELVLPKKGIQEAFETADRVIGQSIRAVTSLVTQPGLIRIGMDDLITALRSTDSRCLFGFGQARGENRAQEALAQALRSPLLDKGEMLASARSVLVHICGSSSMTLFEIETLMRELSKHVSDDAQILFGAATDPKLNEHLTVTVISSLSKESGTIAAQPAAEQTPSFIASASVVAAAARAAQPPRQVFSEAPAPASVPVAPLAPSASPASTPVASLAPMADTVPVAREPITRTRRREPAPNLMVETVPIGQPLPVAELPAAAPVRRARPAKPVTEPVADLFAAPSEPEPAPRARPVPVAVSAPVPPAPAAAAPPAPAFTAPPVDDEDIITDEMEDEDMLPAAQENEDTEPVMEVDSHGGAEEMEESEIIVAETDPGEEEEAADEEEEETPPQMEEEILIEDEEEEIIVDEEEEFEDEPLPAPVAQAAPPAPVKLEPPAAAAKPAATRKFDLREIIHRDPKPKAGNGNGNGNGNGHSHGHGQSAPPSAPQPAVKLLAPKADPRPAEKPVRQAVSAAQSLPDPDNIQPIRPIPAGPSIASPFIPARPAAAASAPVPVAQAAPAPVPAPRRQETFDDRLQPQARGRFDKTEPTMEEGEDLDVPTFLRKRR